MKQLDFRQQVGDRITEVAVAVVEEDKIVDQFQSLVNTGTYISSEITRLTGITNQMTSESPLTL